MTIISSKEFAANQDKYFDMAMDEEIGIKRGENMFNLMCTSIEDNDKYDEILEPDEDFYSAITMDEFKIRAREVVKNAHKRYINEHRNIAKGTCIS